MGLLGYQGRSRLLRWIMWEAGGVAVTKVYRNCNQMAVDRRGDVG